MIMMSTMMILVMLIIINKKKKNINAYINHNLKSTEYSKLQDDPVKNS